MVRVRREKPFGPQRVQVPPGNWFAPPASSRSSGKGNKAAEASECKRVVKGDDLAVPPGQYFVMGDNRDHSLDSRFWGFVPRENIIGRPLFVYWSFDQPEIDELNPSLGEQLSLAANELIHFFDKTRWSRTLHRVQ
jgi:signal peptidase I